IGLSVEIFSRISWRYTSSATGFQRRLLVFVFAEVTDSARAAVTTPVTSPAETAMATRHRKNIWLFISRSIAAISFRRKDDCVNGKDFVGTPLCPRLYKPSPGSLFAPPINTLLQQ